MRQLRRSVIALARRVLPQPVRAFVLRCAISLAPEAFSGFAYRLANAPDPEQGLRAIAARGFTPGFIVDVGAYEGNWTTMVKAIWPAARVLMVEPNPAKREMLARLAERSGAELCSELLSSSDSGEVVFHLLETGSSVLEERSSASRTSQRLTTRSLDAVMAGRKVDLLKIDVQGYEIEVLKGAEKALGRASVLVLELSLIDINAGAPIMHEVVAFLAKRGWIAYDIIEFHRRPLDSALWQIDMIFVPEASALRAKKTLD